MESSAATEAKEKVAGMAEERKVFVGGIPAPTSESDLRKHFGYYGEVKDVVVMRDKDNGYNRGFAFVEFAHAGCVEKALDEKENHVVRGRRVDVKKARAKFGRNQANQSQSSSNHSQDDQEPARNDVCGKNIITAEQKKIFVGGLRDNITDDDFRNYFEKYGMITDVVVMYDRVTHRSRGFGFITFDSVEAVEKVMESNFHELNGTKVEVKVAIPRDGHRYHNDVRHGPFSGKAFNSYRDSIYPEYNHGPYAGFMPPFPLIGYPPYGSISYGNFLPNPIMFHRPYGNLGINYCGYEERGEFLGGVGAGYYEVYDHNDAKHNQTSIDLQTVEANATITAKFETVKLDSQ